MRLKKILSLLLAMIMLFSCVGITAMAEESDAIATVAESGSWYWEDNTLYVYQGKITEGEFYNALVAKYSSGTYKYGTSKPLLGWNLGGTEVKSNQGGTITLNGGTLFVGKKGSSWSWTDYSFNVQTYGYSANFPTLKSATVHMDGNVQAGDQHVTLKAAILAAAITDWGDYAGITPTVYAYDDGTLSTGWHKLEWFIDSALRSGIYPATASRPIKFEWPATGDLPAYTTEVDVVFSDHNRTSNPVVTEPTCTTKGYTTYTCDCGLFTCTGAETAELGHTAGAEATCAIPQTCTVCGDELVAAFGHTWVDATFDAPKTCTTCGATEGEALNNVAEVATADELVAALAAGGEVKLVANILTTTTARTSTMTTEDDEQDPYTYITTGENTVLDLNGYSITPDVYPYGDDETYYLLICGDLAITDNSEGGNGRIYADEGGHLSAECTYVDGIGWTDAPTITIKGGTVTNLAVGNDASVIVEGGNVDLYLYQPDYFYEKEDYIEYLSSLTFSGVTAENLNLPEGYKLADNGDGTLGIIEETTAKNVEVTDAEGNVTYYAGFTGFSELELADCVIKLLADVSDANLILNKGTAIDTNVTLDLNGFTFSREGSSSGAINLTQGSQLTICDTSDEKNGKIISDTYAVWIMNGDLWVESGKIETTSTGKVAIYVNAAEVEINGGNIISAGDAISVGENFMESRGASTISISDGVITAGDCGIVEGSYSSAATALTISGGEINSTNECIAMKEGTASITGGTFSKDVSAYVADGFELVDNGDGTYGVVEVSETPVYVATVNGVGYETLEEAFKAATDGCTIEILSDVVIDYKWDCRDYATGGSHSQFKETVTINGNGHTLKFTGTVSDGNWNTIFRFEENATVKDITIDISEATGTQRVISAKKSLNVDNLKIVGDTKYGIIFGEGASAADLAATEITVTNSDLCGTRRALSDNEGGKDVKSVTVTGNTLNANVYLSASGSIAFNNNTATGEVDLRAYTTGNTLDVSATGNTLNTGKKNYIEAGGTVNAQEEFVVPVVGSVTFGYAENYADYGRIWGQATANARESFVLKLYAGEKLIATTMLNDRADGVTTLIDGKVHERTWSFLMNASQDAWWITTWEPGQPNELVQPDRVVLVVDGVEVSENVVKMTSPDNLKAVEWKDLVGVKKAVLPEAEVKNLGAISVTANEGDYTFGENYYEYDLLYTQKLTTATSPFDISIAMQFMSKDSTEAAKANAYADYTTDFFIKIDGLSNGSFVGDGCYLAGYYPSFGAWVKIPLDGFTVANDKVYPVITSAGFGFSYVDICTSVENFICGIYLTPEIIDENPDINVNLTLGLSESLEKAQNAEFKKVDDYTYTAKDFIKLSGSGTEEDPFLIKNIDDLILFRDSVNSGDTTYNAENVWVALDADIDMAGIDWSVNIGDDCNFTFDGIFDGKNHKISNLTSTETAQKSDGYVCTGLFGAIYGSAQIKNLTIENATIDTGDFTGNSVGVVAGFAYSVTGSIENVNVIGNINIDAPKAYAVGTIIGYAYYGNPTIKDCSVKANADSYINASSEAAGIVGYGGAVGVTGSSVENLTITAEGLVGGIAGLLFEGGSVDNTSVKDVALVTTKDLWVNSAAIAVGTIASDGITVSAVDYANVTANNTATDVMVGSAYTEKPTAVVPAVQAKIGDKYYITLTPSIAAANAGDTVTLLTDIKLTGKLALDKAITLDLNGNILTIADDKVLNISGNLTVNTEGGKINGKFNIATATATITADEGLDVTTSLVGYTVVYSDGKYSLAQVKLFKFDGTTVTLGNSLAINFYVKLADLDGEDYYAEIVLENGEKVTIPYENWSKRNENGVDTYRLVTYDGLAAKQMTDKFSVTIYNGKGIQVSETKIDSMRDYAERGFVSFANNSKLMTALIDMLNYGAAAQVKFNYKTETLANAGCEQYQEYASTDRELTDERKVLVGENVFDGTTLSLENNIVLNAYFKNLTADMNATIEYTTHSGTKKTIDISGDKFIKDTGSAGLHIIKVDTLAVADADQFVTITVYDANGVIYCQVIDSVSSYLYRAMNIWDDDIYKMTARFTYSAREALKSN